MWQLATVVLVDLVFPRKESNMAWIWAARMLFVLACGWLAAERY